MERILFVCLGNICRSPLAEALFQEKLESKGISGDFELDSCGTNGLHNGEPADARTRKNAAQHGINVPSISRQITAHDLDYFDHIFTMDESVQRQVQQLCATDGQKQKVKPFRSLDINAPNADVPDPWYGGEEGFERVFRVIDKNCDLWVDYFLQNPQ